MIWIFWDLLCVSFSISKKSILCISDSVIVGTTTVNIIFQRQNEGEIKKNLDTHNSCNVAVNLLDCFIISLIFEVLTLKG